MCLLNESIANTKSAVRTNSIVSILLLASSFLGSYLHVRPGPATDFYDFIRGLLLGLALTFGFLSLILIVRSRSKNHQHS